MTTLTALTATAKELRRYLFDNNVDVVINDIAYTNKDARRYLFDMINQNQAIEYKVITKTEL